MDNFMRVNLTKEEARSASSHCKNIWWPGESGPSDEDYRNMPMFDISSGTIGPSWNEIHGIKK